jgi:hypothetical protein
MGNDTYYKGTRMNANELADELENTYPFVGVMEIAATMLRQQQAEIKKWTDQYQRLNENLEMWKAGHFKQQAEIEALKQIIDANNLNQNIGQFVKPTNEPVAIRYDFDGYGYQYMDSGSGSDWQTRVEGEFLYTHPVEEQDESFDRTASHMAGEYVAYKAELTDEEIRHIQAICHLKDVGYDGFIMRFARAILRKAQNK